MRFQSFIIGILLMGAVVVGLYAFVNDMAGDNAYVVSVNSTYEESFDKSTVLSTNISDKYDKMQNLSTEKGSAIQIITLVPDVLSLAKDIIVLPFNLLGGIISNITTFMRLPDWVGTFTLSIISVLLIFSFIALVLRYRYT